MFNINTRSVTFNLIMINLLVFIVSGVIGNQHPELGESILRNCALFYPASPLFKPVQIITYMFLHGGWDHIFSNMFGLFMFGATLERVWGPKRFLFFYFFTGIGAALCYLAVQAYTVYGIAGTIHPAAAVVNSNIQLQILYSSPTLGASGAIFGILVAFGMMFPNSEIMLLFFPVPIKAKYFVTLYFLFELFEGVHPTPGDNVAHLAHVGGALFGFILVKIWNRNRDYLY